MDTITPEQRSLNMSRIHSKNTKPELMLRKLLWNTGVRGYRIHYALPGKPDIVFIRKKLAIFVDGCFWHKCPLCFKMPATNKGYWADKIEKNINRDVAVTATLKEMGWTVLRFWEHEIKCSSDEVLKKILDELDH